MAQTNITTGQYVRLNMTAASVLSRITAWLIDGALMACYILIMMSILSIILIKTSQTVRVIFIIFLVVLPLYFYPLVCERFWKGKTLGKHLMNIHVVNLDGSRPTTGQLLIRWLLFIVDGLLLGPCIGLLSIIFTRNSQRLGDLAAGTVVVRAKDYSKMGIRLYDFLFNNPNYRPFYPEAANLSWRQAETIARVLHEPMNIDHRHELIPQLAQQVQRTLNITPVMPPEQFLQTVVNDYYYYDVR